MKNSQTTSFHQPHRFKSHFFWKMSPVLKTRRPRLYEMERLDTKAVRPCVQINTPEAYLQLKSGQIRLDLLWLPRIGGTFGPGSAAYANQLRRSIKNKPGETSSNSIASRDDRGRSVAWILYFGCPLCSRRCRVLYSRKGETKLGCVKCNRPAYPSNLWPYTGRRNARGRSSIERRRVMHEEAATRIRKYLNLNHAAKIPQSSQAPHVAIQKPKNMSWHRFDELSYLLAIHDESALLASLQSAQHLLERLIPLDLPDKTH